MGGSKKFPVREINSIINIIQNNLFCLKLFSKIDFSSATSPRYFLKKTRYISFGAKGSSGNEGVVKKIPAGLS